MKTKLQTRKSRRNYIIVALIVVMLLLGVGYASFTQTLQITGTATGSATWDVHFVSGKIQKDVNGTLTDEVTGALSNSDHTLTMSVNTLAFPGDARIFEAVITNAGTLPAKVTGFTVNGTDVSATVSNTNQTATVNNVIFTYLPLKDDVIAAGGTCTYKFVAQWDPAYTATGTSAQSVGGTYTFDIVYTQDTTAPTLSPSHGAHT